MAVPPLIEQTRMTLDNYLEKLNERIQTKTPEEKPIDTVDNESVDIKETGFITMKRAKLSKLNEPETESRQQESRKKTAQN